MVVVVTTLSPPVGALTVAATVTDIYTSTRNSNDRNYLIHALIDSCSTSKRKEMQSFLVTQPLQLKRAKEFTVRKTSADPTLSHRSKVDRSEFIWETMKTRFGGGPEPEEQACLNEGTFFV